MTGSSGGSGRSCGAVGSVSSQAANASPSRPTCSTRAAERDQQHVLGVPVGDVAAHVRCDAGDLALAQLLDLVLEDERERAVQDEVDLLLGRVAVDAAALTGAQDDLVEAEGRDAERAAERDEALLRVGLERGVADAGVHACIMPTQVSDSSGVSPPWWPLKRELARRIRLQPRHAAGRGQHADVGEAGLQPRPGVREELGREADLRPLAQRVPPARPRRSRGRSTCRKQSRADPAGGWRRCSSSGGHATSR